MSQLRLYYSPGTCSLVPHIALEEIGVPYGAVRIAVADGDNRRPDYLAVNPRGRVPALQLEEPSGEPALTELLAIVTYLAQRFPEAHLLPAEGLPFARALEWLSWMGSTVHQTGARMVFRPERFTTNAEYVEGIREQGRENLLAGLADMEQRLAGKQWALGDRYSIVDAFILLFFIWGNRFSMQVRKHFPEVARIADAVMARPAVTTVIAREGIRTE